MFIFPKQKTFNIGGIKIGGQMNNPPVLIGTIFYKGQDIFTDETKGIFNKKIAKRLIENQEKLFHETGIPCMIDVCGDSKDKILRNIDFVLDITDLPIIIDSPDPNVRMAGLQHAQEIGIIDRIIYNSINMSIKPFEIREIKESGIESAILLCYNPKDSSLNGRIKLLETGAGLIKKGLIDVAKECGITKPLIDTAISPIGNGAGSAIRAIMAVKSKFGFPVGNAIHNAVRSCNWIKDKELLMQIDCASNSLVRIIGADFIMYGPIEHSEKVYRNIFLVECIVGEVLEEIGFKIEKDHPYNRLVSI